MKFGDNLTALDYIALGFIVVQLIILGLSWNFLPSAELDTPYHLLMGKMFSDYNTVMLWDYYEYAPTGRPNLYPPLEHIILWFIHDITQADWWNIGKFISLIQYPLPMLTVWFFSRKLFNPVTALASVVFLSVSGEFWFWQVSVAPTALIIALVPLFLYAFYTKKVILSIVLLTSFLYLHLGLPYIVILSIFLFSLVSLYYTREYMKQFAIVTGVSCVLFLPWIIHIYRYKDWLSSGPPHPSDPASIFMGINILIAVFFVIGILICIEKIKIEPQYVLVLTVTIGFLAVLVYGWRYKMHSPIINCVVTGIGFERVYATIKKNTARKKIAALFLLLLIPLGAFSVTVGVQGVPGNPGPKQVHIAPDQKLHQPVPGQMQNPDSHRDQPLKNQPHPVPGQKPKNPDFQFDKRPPSQPLFHVKSAPFLEMVKALVSGQRPPRVWQINNPEMDELIQWIKDNTPKDEILHVESGLLANYLALFTDRRTDSGMYREVTSPDLFEAIREGKKSGIFILEQDKMKDRRIMPGMTLLEQFGNVFVFQGMSPERGAVPPDISFRLTDFFILIEHPDPALIDHWVTTITNINPKRVYIGIRQKDVDTPEINKIIEKLNAICEVRLSIIVEEPMVTVPFTNITAVRLVVPQEKISAEFIESARNSIASHIDLEIAVLGSPITKNTALINTLQQSIPFVDRIVRHIPPNIESIRIAEQEQTLFKDKDIFFVQIDTYRGEFELQPQELYMLLNATEIPYSHIIIEFRYPPRAPELIEFLRQVYAV
jgi:hypothetical protein